MERRQRWAAAMVAMAAAGCSVFNRIDVCDVTAGEDFQVNQLTTDDQYVVPAQAAVRLPSGQVAVVWNSDQARLTDDVPANPGSVRVALREPDGRFVGAGGTSTGEVTMVESPTQATGHPVIGVGTARDSPVYVAWKQGELGGPSRIFVRVLNRQLGDLCSRSVAPNRSTFELSEREDASENDSYGAVRPTLAVSPDGSRALVAYLVRRPGVAGFSLKYRPVTAGMATNVCGRIEPNPLDGRNAPGLVAQEGTIGQPFLAALRDGFVLVWPDMAEGRWVARWRFMDPLGAHPMDRPGEPASPQTTELGGVATPYSPPLLALALDGDDLILAWDRARVASPLQREVVFRRFTRDLRPLTNVVRVSIPPGDQNTPSVVALPRGAVMVAWDDDTRGTAATEALARVFDRNGAPVFTSASCERGPFRLSTLVGGRRLASNLVRVGDRVVAVYADTSRTTPDTFGHAVRGRSFVIPDLVPGLR